MIKDKIENIGNYKLNDHFEAFKKAISKEIIPPLNLDSPFRVISLEYETKDFDLTKFENHSRNIDIHYIIEGSERVGINTIKNVRANIPYNEEGDFQLFDGDVRDEIVLERGDFLLLFPGEVHVTGGGGNKIVKKIVYKIPY